LRENDEDLKGNGTGGDLGVELLLSSSCEKGVSGEKETEGKEVMRRGIEIEEDDDNRFGDMVGVRSFSLEVKGSSIVVEGGFVDKRASVELEDIVDDVDRALED
jgi:hypothetical protein